MSEKNNKIIIKIINKQIFYLINLIYLINIITVLSITNFA